MFHLRRLSVISAVVSGLAAQALFADESVSKLRRRQTSKDGKVILELQGDVWGYPTSAWLVSPSTGKKTFLANAPATYIASAVLSEDGQLIVLEYHISSGGDAEAFERAPDGKFRKFLENLYALDQLRAGRVSGLTMEDLPETHGRNLYCGMSLARSPDRIIFTFDHALHLTYSLKSRRIVDWERSIFLERGPAGIELRELSGQRGFALVTTGVEIRAARAATLITFPWVSLDRHALEIQLRRKTRNGEVVLTARVNEAETAREELWKEEAVWDVQVSGRGREFEALVARLSKKLTSYAAKGNRPNPTKFSVTGNAPVGFTVVRQHRDQVAATSLAVQPTEPVSAGGEVSAARPSTFDVKRAALLDKARRAIEQGDYRGARDIYEEIRASDAAKVPP